MSDQSRRSAFLPILGEGRRDAPRGTHWVTRSRDGLWRKPDAQREPELYWFWSEIDQGYNRGSARVVSQFATACAKVALAHVPNAT